MSTALPLHTNIHAKLHISTINTRCLKTWNLAVPQRITHNPKWGEFLASVKLISSCRMSDTRLGRAKSCSELTSKRKGPSVAVHIRYKSNIILLSIANALLCLKLCTCSLIPRPHPAHTRRRGLVSQVQILGLAPEAWSSQSDRRTAFTRIMRKRNQYFNRTAQSDVMIFHTDKFVILH